LVFCKRNRVGKLNEKQSVVTSMGGTRVDEKTIGELPISVCCVEGKERDVWVQKGKPSSRRYRSSLRWSELSN